MNAKLSIEDRDSHMIDRMKLDATPESERRSLWAEMWRHSPERQQQFPEQGDYVAFMEANFRGVLSVYTQAERRSNYDHITEDCDAMALDVAKAQGYCESDRMSLWTQLWRHSPERRQEFPEQGDYTSFMESCFRGSASVRRSRRRSAPAAAFANGAACALTLALVAAMAALTLTPVQNAACRGYDRAVLERLGP